MARIEYAYVALGAAFAVVIGSFRAQFVGFQALALTVFAGVIAAESIRRADTSFRLEVPPLILRSRVSHYVKISKVDATRLISVSSNPFEKELLGKARWASLTQKEMARLGTSGGAPKPAPEVREARAS